MRIDIQTNQGRALKIVLPTGLALNRVTALIFPGALEKKGIHMTREQAIRIVQIIRRCRRNHSSWKLVEMKMEDGSCVDITL